MKKGIVLTIIVLGALVALIFLRNTFVIRLNEEQIKASMEESLPLTKTYLWIFEVTLANPEVDLQPGSTRVNGGLDVGIEIGALGFGKVFQGNLMFSGGVDFNPETKEFFLIDPVIESLKVDGLPGEKSDQAKEALGEAFAAYCSLNPIYTLEVSDAKTLAARALLKSVVVEGEELVITLGL